MEIILFTGYRIEAFFLKQQLTGVLQNSIPGNLLKTPEKFFRVDVCRGLNPLTSNVPHHVETSELICNANQWIGFYMIGNIAR